MHLALRLGYPSRQAMYREMSATELLEWQLLYRLNPWGEHRADLRAGVVASAVLTPNNPHPPKPSDFLLFAKTTKRRKMRESDMKAEVASFAKAAAKMRAK